MSWNIRGNTGIRVPRQQKIVDVIERNAADIVAIQEVYADERTLRPLTALLAAKGLLHTQLGTVRAGSANMLASRWPMVPLDDGWFSGPRPGAAMACSVESPQGDIIAICTHVPNGSANGWVKIETFEALATAIHRLTGPVLLGGDFNEPRSVLEDGVIIPYGMKQDKSGTWHMRGYSRRCGQRFPRARWARGVRSILGREASVNLVHAVRATDGPTAWHITHVVRGGERYFDHILVSPHFKTSRSGFDHECRLQKTSDHSAVWADVVLR